MPIYGRYWSPINRHATLIRMKIVFFGTANVALPILEVLNKHHQVLAVVTNPDAPAGRSGKPQENPVSALAMDLKLKMFKPESVKNNPDFLAQLQNIGRRYFCGGCLRKNFAQRSH